MSFIEITEGQRFRNPHVKDTGWSVIRDRGPMVDLHNERTDKVESYSKWSIKSYLIAKVWTIVTN